MAELLYGISLCLLLDKTPAAIIRADGTNGCSSAAAGTVAAPAEAMKWLQPVDKHRCESIQGLSCAVKTEVLMDIQL